MHKTQTERPLEARLYSVAIYGRCRKCLFGHFMTHALWVAASKEIKTTKTFCQRLLMHKNMLPLMVISAA